MRTGAAGLAAIMLAVAAAPAPDLAWLYPGRGTPQTGGMDTGTGIVDGGEVTLPGSTQHYPAARLHDLQTAIDWFPATHPPLPAAVARGPSAEIGACAFCHQPDGAGRPENASLAGLPQAYLVAQIAAMRAGTRHGLMPDWIPSNTMVRIAHGSSDADIAAAAQYFSGQPCRSHVRVVEAATVPRTIDRAFIHMARPDGGREPIGARIIEIPDDFAAFEKRDPRATYTAYVPPGSIARGASLAARIGCPECHARLLGGWGPGRPPGYTLRQLHGFRSGARADAAAAPMQAVVAQLTDDDMIDVAAWYAAQAKLD